MPGTLGRARAALGSREFRLLLGSRLTSQFADGLFQAFLVAELVFLDPARRGTALGVATVTALLVVPYSLVGPLAGVFIDRWSRRRILTATPLLRALAAAPLALAAARGPALYAPALAVVSLNRFFLSTAAAVMPTFVPQEDLLVGNAMATVGGTVLTFLGIVVGTKLADPLGAESLVVATALLYPVASLLASRIADPLRAIAFEGSVRAHVSRVLADLRAGARRLAATPAAMGSIVSVSLDQFLIGIVTVLSLVVFKEQFHQGIGSYGNLIAAGGAGVLAGTVTVGWLESLLPKPRIVAVAFALAGLTSVAAAPALAGPTILLLSFVLGLTFSWRKIPVDTLVQESVPDRYRGRVFAVYDLVYAMARVVAGGIAVLLIPVLSTGSLVATVGIAYLAWAPIAPWWIARRQRVRVRFYEGARAEEVPRAVEIGGEEQPVEVLRSWLEERADRRMRRFRVRAADGTRLDLEGDERTGRWTVDPPAAVLSRP